MSGVGKIPSGVETTRLPADEQDKARRARRAVVARKKLAALAIDHIPNARDQTHVAHRAAALEFGDLLSILGLHEHHTQAALGRLRDSLADPNRSETELL